MIETEVKIRIENPEAISKILHEKYFYESSYHKEDTYYENKDTKKRFRIRNDGGNYVTTKLRNGKGAFEINKEIEFGVDNENILNFTKFMELTGFKESYSKTKIGERFLSQDKFTLELSNVLYKNSSLGYFLEIEFLSENEPDTEFIKDNIYKKISDIGLLESDIEEKRYSDLITDFKNNNGIV